MAAFVIACDLGTGGNKAALFDADGVARAEAMVPYTTHYPRPEFHEQRPDDWYDAVKQSIGALLAEAPTARTELAAISISAIFWRCLVQIAKIGIMIPIPIAKKGISSSSGAMNILPVPVQPCRSPRRAASSGAPLSCRTSRSASI